MCVNVIDLIFKIVPLQNHLRKYTKFIKTHANYYWKILFLNPLTDQPNTCFQSICDDL